MYMTDQASLFSTPMAIIRNGMAHWTGNHCRSALTIISSIQKTKGQLSVAQSPLFDKLLLNFKAEMIGVIDIFFFIAINWIITASCLPKRKLSLQFVLLIIRNRDNKATKKVILSLLVLQQHSKILALICNNSYIYKHLMIS